MSLPIKTTNRENKVLQDKLMLLSDMTAALKDFREEQMSKDKGKAEKDVLKECLQVLKDLNIYAWRQNTGSFKTANGGFFRSSMAGVSDILGIMPDGRFLAIECKRASGGIVSEAQKNFLSHIDNAGGVAIVSNDSVKLKELLTKELNKCVTIV